ncbi:ribonuclease HII [Ectobacillus polymachus]|uniref:ribonuclease HII n=1 Tax=Ectobacillus polymachus TaxID=1508806 RepID=UPI003A885A51
MGKTIHDIGILLEDITSEKDERFMELLQDERKGVQTLVKRWRKRKEKDLAMQDHFIEMTKYEASLHSQGVNWIAGIDEVGRGPLAGPVVAAAVVLPESFFLPGLNDSKQLSEGKRDQFFDYIQEHAIAVGVGVVPAERIDEINIYQATKQAMMLAISNLSITPEHLLIDAMKLPVELMQTSIIKGDCKSISIAASSVVAKVTRDRMMKKLGKEYPSYGFERNMGYGTKEHLEAIHKHGILPFHRKSFAPIKDMLD